MEMQNQTKNLSVVCQKIQLSEIYKGGNNCNIEIIEEVSKLPNKSFFDLTYQAQKIKELYADQYFKGHLAVVLVKICALSGIKSEIDDFTKRDILNLISTRFKHLSVVEIWKAFELERYSVYDDKTEHFQLFDSSYISTILKKYENWKANEKRALNYVAPDSEKLPEITESQKFEIMTNAIIESFNYFKQHGKLSDDIQVHIFDELAERGFIITKSNEKYSEKMLTEYFTNQQNKAYKELQEEYSIGLKTENRDLFKSKLKELENGIYGGVTARMKRNILSDFFQKYKDDETFIHKIKKHEL